VALVTGASSGIGRATARRLAALGAQVHGAARRREAIPAEVEAHALDVTDRASVDALAARLPRLDLLVVAAGTNVTRRTLGELDEAAWEQLVGVNLTGAFRCLSATLPALRAARGLAVIVASVSGLWPDVSGPGYQAAKAGAIALARGAALEEREHGVRVSTVLPGLVDTPLLDIRRTPPDPETRAQALRPEDVADACAYLACLPERVVVPELTILPAALHTLGRTS
jgi:NAD(P)-dependent dehydrogenase (short-subunit alcohol dehydrogenase family)